MHRLLEVRTRVQTRLFSGPFRVRSSLLTFV